MRRAGSSGRKSRFPPGRGLRCDYAHRRRRLADGRDGPRTCPRIRVRPYSASLYFISRGRKGRLTYCVVRMSVAPLMGQRVDVYGMAEGRSAFPNFISVNISFSCVFLRSAPRQARRRKKRRRAAGNFDIYFECLAYYSARSNSISPFRAKPTYSPAPLCVCKIPLFATPGRRDTS